MPKSRRPHWSVNMIRINEDVLIRREWFGCLVCTTTNGFFHQFNEDMFVILRELLEPTSVRAMVERLRQRDFEIPSDSLEKTLADLRNRGIVVESDMSVSNLVYHENRGGFRRDCLVAPSSVTIYISDFCSKTCTHCVTRSSPFVDRSGEYGLEEWTRALQKLRDFGVMALVFTGGDPLLKKDIFEILQRADEMKFAISLLTDYDGLNEGHLSRLKSLRRLIDVQVSLDGATTESHDAIRGRGSFRLALRRMRLLADHGIPYTISSTVNNRNFHELPKVVEIYREYGAKYLYLNPLAPYGRAKEQMGGYLLNDEQLRALAGEYLRLAESGEIDPGNPFWEANFGRSEDRSFHPFAGALTAVSIGMYNLSVGSRGECYLDSKMKSEGLLPLGNILKDDLESIWYNSKLDHLRAHYSPDAFTFTDQSNVLDEGA